MFGRFTDLAARLDGDNRLSTSWPLSWLAAVVRSQLES